MKKDKLLISLYVIESGTLKGDYRADFIHKADNFSGYYFFDSMVYTNKAELIERLRHRYNMECPKKAIHI